MRKLYFALFLFLACTVMGFAQLSTGDLSFIAFNADGEDDFAVVTFVDIPANTVFYISDKEWDGSAFTSGEETYSWETGETSITAGTVVVFNSIDNAENRMVSHGTLVGESGGISATDEGIFIFQGTDEDTPTTFICAIANDSAGYGDLTGTGLAEGSTAITLPSSTDIAAYKGVRSGLTVEAYRTALNDMANYDLQSGGGDQSIDTEAPDLPFDTTMFTLGDGTVEPTPAVITFDEKYTVVDEGGTATIKVVISEAPSTDASVELKVVYPGASSDVDDEVITFSPEGALEQFVVYNFPDNASAEPDFVYGLELVNANNADLGDDITHAIYILDDETHAPAASGALGITFGASYKIEGDNPGSEIVAHDPETERLFVMNSGNASIEVLDFSDPLNISTVMTIDLGAYGDEGTSVAVMDGIVAATAVPDDKNLNGKVVFFDTAGNYITNVEVGSLPDMVTFTPDGTKVLTANEGEPSSDYSIDPEGTVSVIDISGGVAGLTAANVTTLDFNIFDDKKDELIAAGIRIFGPGATVSQDLEPEYIAVSEDSEFAWVTLQENNAVAVIGLDALQMNTLFPLGYKDHSIAGNELDASNEQDFIFMANWPIYGMYQPDGIATYNIGGVNYFVTANKGDAREYDTLEEETDLADLDLDETAFPDADFLLLDENLGKISFTSQTGDTDGDGDMDELYVFGGRSFSIYNQNTGQMVYDSGDDFERIIAEDSAWYPIFNATDDENEFKNRSDNKGPEPESVIVKEIEGKWYAFIGLERVGGFMAYDVSNPASPVFEGYYNNRSTNPGEDITGDLAPEGMIYVKPEDNGLEKGLVVIANEVSATISVYTLDNVTLSNEDFAIAKNTFKVFPNPVAGNHVFFAQPTTYALYDIQGRELRQAENAVSVEVGSLATGTYILRNEAGATQKILVK